MASRKRTGWRRRAVEGDAIARQVRGEGHARPAEPGRRPVAPAIGQGQVHAPGPAGAMRHGRRPGRPDFEVRTEVVHRGRRGRLSGGPAVDSVAVRESPTADRKNNGLGDAKAGARSTAAERRSKVVSGRPAACGIGSTIVAYVIAIQLRETSTRTSGSVSGPVRGELGDGREARALRPARRPQRHGQERQEQFQLTRPPLDPRHELPNDLGLRPASPVDVQEHRRPEPAQGVRPQIQRSERQPSGPPARPSSSATRASRTSS